MKLKIYRQDVSFWYIERFIFLIAGLFILLSLLLGYYVHQNWFLFTGFVGILQIIFSLTGFCPLAILLNILGIKSK